MPAAVYAAAHRSFLLFRNLGDEIAPALASAVRTHFRRTPAPHLKGGVPDPTKLVSTALSDFVADAEHGSAQKCAIVCSHRPSGMNGHKVFLCFPTLLCDFDD